MSVITMRACVLHNPAEALVVRALSSRIRVQLLDSCPRCHVLVPRISVGHRGFAATSSGGRREPLLGFNSVDVWDRHVQPCPAAKREDVELGEPIAGVIDGKAIAQVIRREIAEEVVKMKETVGIVPGLAVILVGSRTDSATYVRSKKKACQEVGFASFGVELPEDATEDEVLQHVHKFNSNPAVHGILVQLPLPLV